MPPSTQASSTPQASSANFIGGTTKQLELETKGRARKVLLAACDRVEHLQRRRDVLAHGEGRADMFRRAHHAGIERVEVHIERVGNVARHHRPLEEMDVVEPVDDARGVVDVLQQRLAVFALLDVDQMDRGAGRAVMHALALDQHVVLRILAVQREIARGAFDRVLDQARVENGCARRGYGSRRRASAPRCRRGWRWRSRRFRAASAPLRGCGRGRLRRAPCTCRLRGPA